MCLQLHSLSSDKGVSGFIGGKRYYREGKLWLYLLRYKPFLDDNQLKNSCELPLSSQRKETILLQSEGFELLGFFHSHPNHPRKPSKKDVETQKDIQLNSKLGQDRPLIGLIFSCLDMKMRCIYIHPNDLNSEGPVRPYDLEVAITKEHKHFSIHVTPILGAMVKSKICDVKKVFNKVGFLNLNKFLQINKSNI